MSFSSILEELLDEEALVAPARVEALFDAIFRGEAGEAVVGAVLVALRRHERRPEILAAIARSMRKARHEVRASRGPLVDTCGTGGDHSGTFNVSTTVAFVLAGAGAAVAKHGNRSVTSKSGSADVLEALGCAIDLAPEAAGAALDQTGFAFLFAQRLHPAMKNVGPVRRALGIRTIFNLLGPLANPAGARRQLLGTFDVAATEVMARALLDLGTEDALVVHCEGLDEIGLHGVTRGHRVRGGALEAVTLTPADFGLAPVALADLRGGDAMENAGILRAILAGERGPKRDVVLANAAAALHVAGLAPSLREGVALAAEVIDSGKASGVLDAYAPLSRALAAGVAP
jgi:anthranilate phosphoribosyltransferase